jgi:hypothetical protein
MFKKRGPVAPAPGKDIEEGVVSNISAGDLDHLIAKDRCCPLKPPDLRLPALLDMHGAVPSLSPSTANERKASQP